MSDRDHFEVDPFTDPSNNSSQQDLAENQLAVGRNASLTLGTDSLIVLDEGFTHGRSPRCCGLIEPRAKTTRAIPFFNILWAELLDLEIAIHYTHSVSKDVVRPAVIQYLVDKLDRAWVTAWIGKLLDRAYGISQRNKRIKVLINPFGGKGNAPKWYSRDIEPIFVAARCTIDLERTQFKGHAVEIAEKLDIDTYDVIATCSGDGLPHEVFNGLGRKGEARKAFQKVAVAQLPCGSGNGMSLSLNGTNSPSFAALCVVKGIRTPLDLISITQGERRTLSFLSQAVGIIADADLGTENMRWLGEARFTIGLCIRLLRKTIYPCDLAVKVEVDSKAIIRDRYQTQVQARISMEERRRQLEPPPSPRLGESEGLPELKYGTINDELPADWQLIPYNNLGNFYCGNMSYMAAETPLFPASLPNDGCMDLVTIDGDISRLSSVKILTAVAKNKFFDMPLVTYRKILAYRIIPKNQKDGYISIDGESMESQPFQAEIHRGLGTVLSRNGHTYEGVRVDDQENA